jgi:vacuolar-type H+-ATPase subunit D/Vma8
MAQDQMQIMARQGYDAMNAKLGEILNQDLTNASLTQRRKWLAEVRKYQRLVNSLKIIAGIA